MKIWKEIKRDWRVKNYYCLCIAIVCTLGYNPETAMEEEPPIDSFLCLGEQNIMDAYLDDGPHG
jgi:hypothetical protein